MFLALLYSSSWGQIVLYSIWYRHTKKKTIKTNKKLDELIKQRNIINYVKAQRLSWFGQTNRMPEKKKHSEKNTQMETIHRKTSWKAQV